MRKKIDLTKSKKSGIFDVWGKRPYLKGDTMTNGEREQNERILQSIAEATETYGSIYEMPFFEFEDLFEDRDPFEFL